MKRFQFQLLSVGTESKDLEDGEILKEAKFKFPASNSMTRVDRKYFGMIRSEAEWGNSTYRQNKVSHLQPGDLFN